jgi:hypothetical protein
MQLSPPYRSNSKGVDIKTENIMRKALLAAAGFACLAIGSASGANAAPAALTLLPNIETRSLAEPVAYRTRYVNHCVRWRHECRQRWGFGTWRFRRCMSIHGCW